MTTSAHYDKFRRLLAELFMFDQADLDFGIYRIMNAKRGEIERFLERDLPYQNAGWWHSGFTEAQFNQRHVFFRKPGDRAHIAAILEATIASCRP